MKASKSSEYSNEIRFAKNYAACLRRFGRLAKHIGIPDNVSIEMGGVSYKAYDLAMFRSLVRRIRAKFPGYRIKLNYASAVGTNGLVQYRLERDGMGIPVYIELRMAVKDMPKRLLLGNCAFRKKTELVPAHEKEYYVFSCEKES